MSNEKVAFVIAGEGARGAAQATILNHLVNKLHIFPSAIYGVSSGAINSAGYAYLGAERLLKIWSKLNSISKVFQFNYLTFPWASGLFNVSPIRKILEREITTNVCSFIPAHIAVMDRSSTQIKWVSSHDCETAMFREFVLGAISISGLIQPPHNYSDAGARVIAPLLKPIRDGYKKIVIISGSPLGVAPQKRQPRLFPSMGEGLNFVSTLLDEIMLRDIRKALERNARQDYEFIDVEMFTPDKYLYDSLDFGEIQRGLECTPVKANLLKLFDPYIQ